MKQLFLLNDEVRFEVEPMHLCEVDVRVSQLAAALDTELERWEEDGLGEAVGFAVQLPDGTLVLVRELVHAIRLGSKGPTLQVDARQLADKGIDALMATLLPALGLKPEDVSWQQGEEAVALARSFCATVDAR